jgi:phenylalanyl-tRNA synthetase beta subunit
MSILSPLFDLFEVVLDQDRLKLCISYFVQDRTKRPKELSPAVDRCVRAVAELARVQMRDAGLG